MVEFRYALQSCINKQQNFKTRHCAGFFVLGYIIRKIKKCDFLQKKLC